MFFFRVFRVFRGSAIRRSDFALRWSNLLPGREDFRGGTGARDLSRRNVRRDETLEQPGDRTAEEHSCGLKSALRGCGFAALRLFGAVPQRFASNSTP